MVRLRPYVLVLLPAVAPACMGVGRSDQPVRFAGQTNIVIWDKEHGMEHFVRDAKFETNGPDLGFIAPTPTRPEVAGVDKKAFDLLSALVQPHSGGSRGSSSDGMGGGAGGVTVIETKVVSGYEATVLKASDPQALDGWLASNGYAVPGYAVRWIAPYVLRGWYFTAFKVAAGDGAGATGPVRLSFRTDVPFSPYSVPGENRGPGGLRLYYVSASAENAKIGGVQPWVESRVSNLVSDGAAVALATDLKLPSTAIPRRSFVHLYLDRDFGRPGFDDVYFVPSPKPIRPVRMPGVFAIGGRLPPSVRSPSSEWADARTDRRRLRITAVAEASHPATNASRSDLEDAPRRCMQT